MSDRFLHLRLPVFVLPVALLILLLASSSYLWRSTAQAEANNWNYAAQSAPPGLMSQVVRDNIAPNFPIDPGRMRIWIVQQSGQSQPLYLVDSRIAPQDKFSRANPLCGALGCAFFGYIRREDGSYQEVFNSYLDVNLPPDVPLVEPTEDIQEGLPSLKINQQEGNQIRELTLSFNGREYEVVESVLHQKIYE